jgi:hypothetical protein
MGEKHLIASLSPLNLVSLDRSALGFIGEIEQPVPRSKKNVYPDSLKVLAGRPGLSLLRF